MRKDSWSAWLAQLVEHMTQSQDPEFKPQVEHGAYFKKQKQKQSSKEVF